MDPRRAASEWLETNGLGGYASGTVGLVRTRRYHALLVAATRAPTGRMALVSGVEAFVETPGGRFALTSHRYTPDVLHPDGASRLVRFDADPWPRWTFDLDDGTEVVQELSAVHGTSAVALTFHLARPGTSATLTVRPLLSGRDHHALHRENGAFRFDPVATAGGLLFRPYEGVPGVLVRSNGRYQHQPEWYRNFLYLDERARGLDHVEDLASPGVLTFDLTASEAALVFAAVDGAGALLAGRLEGEDAPATVAALRKRERERRDAFPSALERAADAYVVRRGAGRSIIAGYPWFTDWGRDTFIALRGLCLATGRLDDARSILVEWAGAVSEGMLPNRFPEQGGTPEYNSADASLWYVNVVGELLSAFSAAGKPPGDRELGTLRGAVDAILLGYAGGTRHRIRLDEDALLAAGVPGQQLTWMDARVDGREVTPRIGKPVELQALWVNALDVGAALSPGHGRSWARLRDRAIEQFRARFWNEAGGCLHDVVDVDHRAGQLDDSFRANQILAVGGLRRPLLDPTSPRARRVVDAVEERLLTPLGLRSLAPGSPGYQPHYRGGVASRDGAYHQGTVWPWLMGPFVEAWVRVRGNEVAARAAARGRFVAPLLSLLPAWNGHIPELADAEAPHQPGGCPFQAWSLAELIRLDRLLDE